MVEVRGVVSDKDIIVTGENLVTVGVEEGQFDAHSALAGLLLSGLVMAVNGLVAGLPQGKKLGP